MKENKLLERCQLLERDNLKMQKLCRESLALVHTFFGLACSPEKKIVFADRYDVDQFLRGVESLEYRLKREIERVML